MTEEKIEILRDQLNNCLSDKKLYLDKNLSLAKLSAELGTNTFYLSKVINSCFSMNFKTFINQFRIIYCMEYIESNIEQIISADFLAQISGFKSTSVFYRVFKRETQLSPQKYREKILKTKY